MWRVFTPIKVISESVYNPYTKGNWDTEYFSKIDPWTTSSLRPSSIVTSKTYCCPKSKKAMATCILYFTGSRVLPLKNIIRDKKTLQTAPPQPLTAHKFLTLECKGPHSVVACPIVCRSWLVQIPWRGQNHPEPCFDHPAHFAQVTARSPYLHHWQRGTLQHKRLRLSD